jgi:hypothetical protein
MFNVLWAYAFRRGLIAGTSANAPRTSAARGFIIGPFAYLAATLIAFVNPFLSMAGFAALAIYWMLPGRIPSGR